MPNTVNTGLAGAIVSLLAHLRNQGRKNGVSAPEEPAATSGQAASPPQAPSAAPTGGDSAVRFDFSAPPAQAAAAAAPATAVVKAAAPAAHVAAAPLSAAAGSAAAQGGNSAGAATPRTSGAGGQKGAGAAVPASFSEPARLPEPADPDDEARARAWAIRTIARENTLSMIGQIARVSERPEAGKAGTESGHGSHAARDSEPRTLARA